MEFEAHYPPFKRLLFFCLVWLFGTALHAFFETTWLSVWRWGALVSVMVFVVVYLWIAQNKFRLFALLALVFLTSLMRYDVALRHLPSWVAPPTSSVQYSGTVQALRGDGIGLEVTHVSAPGLDPPGFPIMLRSNLPLMALPGDRVAWNCRASPINRDESAPPDLSLGKAGWVCRVGSVSVLKEGGLSWARILAELRGLMRSLVYGMMPPTEASLLMGLLAGERSDLPPALSAAFRDTGTTHILAVSGYNIARVTGAVLVALASLQMARRRAIGWSAVAVVAFTVFVGCGASVIRAALMGCLALAAAHVERRYDSGLGLVVAAAVMLVVSPLSLRHDLGFQLSFAAVLGLRYFGPPIAKFLTKAIPAAVASPLADSLAAVIATAPIILYCFGVLAPVAPLTNLLVAPLVPTAMLTGAFAAALSFIVPVMAPVFGFLPWLLLKLITTVVTVTAAVPTWELEIDFLGFAAWSVALAAVAYRLRVSGRQVRRFI